MKNTAFHLLFVLLLAGALLLAAGCDCGDDDDDDNDAADDDVTDDDIADDDVTDDDVVDDDIVDDDIVDDDIVDDDTIDDDIVDDDTTVCDWSTHDPLIVDGKTYLSENNAPDAYDNFLEALEVCPDSADARLGMLLADTQWYVGWFNYWINFLLNFNPAPHEGGKSIGTVIQRLIREYMQPINYEMFALAEELMNDYPDVRFYVDPLPMWVDGDHVVIDMGGEWDLADVNNVYAFTQFLEGFEQFLLSFDFTFNYNTFAMWPSPGGSIKEIIHSYSELLLELLADPDYPDFLTFLDGGEENLIESGVQSGHACLRMVDSFAMALDEVDPQEDDVLGYIDENGNGQWDPGENYKIPFFGPLSEELDLLFLDLFDSFSDLGGAFLDGGPDDLHPALPDWFSLASLNPILELMDLLLLGQRLPPIPVPIGRWFYHPLDDGLRSGVGAIAELLFNLTMPDQEGGAL